MKINLSAWKLNSVTRREDGTVKMFSSAPIHANNVRVQVEAANVAELNEKLEKFAEEMRETGRAYVIGAFKANERGNRAFRGFEDAVRGKQIFINEDKAVDTI